MKKDTIIQNIIKSVISGVYAPGKPFESVRSLCQLYAISHVTAYEIINELEMKGLLVKKHKSRSIITSDPSILKNYEIDYAKINIAPKGDNILPYLLGLENHRTIVNLGTALKIEDVVPIKKLLDKIGSRNIFFKKVFSQYSYPPGNLELRVRLSKLLSTKNHIIDHDNIVLTNGALEGIKCALDSIIENRDTILVFTPIFYGITHTIKNSGYKFIEVCYRENNKLPLEEIEHLLQNNKKIKCALIQSIHNHPTGLSLAEGQKEKLVTLFKKYNRFIIEDDTYKFLSFNKKIEKSLIDYDIDNETVFSCSSFSKVLGPGLKIGWIIAPKKIKDKVISQKIAMSFSTQSLNEELVLHILNNSNEFKKHIDKVRDVFKANVKIALDILSKKYDREYIIKPKGGFSIFIKLKNKKKSFDLYSDLLETGIAITPGNVYSLENRFDDYIRINCAIEFNDKIRESLDLITEKLVR